MNMRKTHLPGTFHSAVEKWRDYFLPDYSYGAVLEGHWHPGHPRMTKFLGISTGTKVEREEMLPVTAWRCDRCGLLRSYAHPLPPGEGGG